MNFLSTDLVDLSKPILYRLQTNPYTIPILLDIGTLLLYSTYESMYIKLVCIMKANTNTIYA